MLHGSEHRDDGKRMVKLTIEQLRQQARDIRKAAKELQRKMQEVTDPEERKQLARRMNELFALAK
jgi:5-methylcytosine-specific restriction endonuclease McrBC regulatory subunit McrC